ncbi:Protein of unknown function DUF227 [Trinorchestia longiramus]|nr:Protein of unknown function DUF227 [Trinorchestia longiramus]
MVGPRRGKRLGNVQIREVSPSTMSAELNTNEKAHKLITSDILKIALLKDKGPDARLMTFEIIDFCSKGDNYACFVTSVKVVYLHKGQTKNVTYIAKLNHCHGLETLEQFSEIVFVKEGKFYQQLVPDLNNVMEEISQPSLKFASCYYASFEPTRQVILLSDKREYSFKMADRFVGLDDDHVVLVVKELARLHAASVILEDRLGNEKLLEKYDFLDDFFTGDKTKDMLSMFENLFVGYVNNGAKIADRITGYEKVSAWLKEQAPSSFGTLNTVMRECDPKFKAIGHGDCWNNNLLFRYKNGKVVDVCLLDLQVNRHASLALDLNYFFFTSLNGETRKKGLESYLTAYYNSFKEVFDAAQKPMKFTREELYTEYRNKNLFGLLMGLMVLPIVVMQSTDVPDFNDVNEENMQEKMEAQQQKVLDMIDTSPVLRPRMLDMFDEMVEHGTINVKKEKKLNRWPFDDRLIDGQSREN